MKTRSNEFKKYYQLIIRVFFLLGTIAFMSCPSSEAYDSCPSSEAYDTWTVFTTSDGLANESITTIAIDASDGKWFGSRWGNSGGVSYLDDNGTPTDKTDDTWTVFTTSDGLGKNDVWSIAIDPSGGKWFCNRLNFGGVSYLDDNGTPTDKSDDTWAVFTTADGLADNQVCAVGFDLSGGKWFGTYPTSGSSAKVSYLDDNATPADKSDDTWTTFTSADTDGLSYSGVWAIAIDESGGKWFGTVGGVSYLDDNGTPTDKSDDTWTVFTTSDGIPGSGFAISIDESGGKWFARGGTSGPGIVEGTGGYYLDDNGTPTDKADDTWITFSTSDGLASCDVHAIAIDTSGGIWFGTYGYGVSFLDANGTPTDKADDTWITFTTSNGLADNYVWAIAIDSSGGKWFGTGFGVSYCP